MSEETIDTRLDEFLPHYQFSEFHQTHVAAAPVDVYRAMRAVRASEIRFFRTLTWLRRLGRSGPASILNAPDDRPLIDVATQTGFIVLAEQHGHELVIGTTVIAPRDMRASIPATPDELKRAVEPGFALAAMNFRIRPDGTGSRLSTETRVFATDADVRRRFARYWRIIYPGSALIRRNWLRAIARRAER